MVGRKRRIDWIGHHSEVFGNASLKNGAEIRMLRASTAIANCTGYLSTYNSSV